MDLNFWCLRYVGYVGYVGYADHFIIGVIGSHADHFIIGVTGSHADAYSILNKIKMRLKDNLKLELHPEKTKVVMLSSEYLKFLGVVIGPTEGSKDRPVRLSKYKAKINRTVFLILV